MTTTKTPLTNREEQVLGLLSQGNSRKMIASELELRNNTINSYLKSIYQKLEVNSATQAVSLLWRQQANQR